MSDYYSNCNEDLLKAIPPCSKQILEVGCGTGELAKRFKRIQPKCQYWGVEANEKAWTQATADDVIDEVFHDDIELWLGGKHLHFGSGDENFFDCIVLGDVLEHLQNPEEILKDLAQLLEPNGRVIACIPNVQHWSVVETLLNGRWPREDAGLFDRTHLRWFTKSEIVAMFERLGLTVDKIVPRRLFPGGERIIEAARAYRLVDDVDELAENLNAYQWVVSAVKGTVDRRILIRGFPAEACCARPRLTEPGTFLNTIPGVRYSETPVKVDEGEAVVVVLQRHKITEDAVRTHLKNGCLIIGEWDDDPWYEGFRDKLKVPSVEWALKACHAITVSNLEIAKRVERYNDNVAIHDNWIAEVGEKQDEPDRSRKRIFLGGQRSREDWEPLVPGLNRFASKCPEAEFVVVHDKELFDALETKNKTFYAFQPYAEYRKLLASCDISIDSLGESLFNRCKSFIRFIDSEAEGCSNHFVMHAIADRLDVIIEGFFDPRTPREHHRQHVIQYHMLADAYLGQFEKIREWLDDKPRLDEELYARLPELR